MSTGSKPVVLVIGGTGHTGQPLVKALIEHNSFHVATLIRPQSAFKPAVEALKSIGVEIRLGDFAHDSVAKLAEILSGVDVLVSVITSEAILDQKTVLEAAKQAGVKRVVPCDFGTACPPGRREVHDNKLVIRSFVRQLGVSYTFVDVGWWNQLILPQPKSIVGWIAELSYEVYGTGDVKSAITDIGDIGRFLARIIEDPRTVNQYVFCWSEHVSQNEVYKIAERVGGEPFSDRKVHISDPSRLAAEYQEKSKNEEGEISKIKFAWYEYAASIYIHADNTLEKAKAQGALDARELYPDFKPLTLEESAKIFYDTGIMIYSVAT